VTKIETLLDTSRQVGLKLNAERNYYTLIFCNQKAGPYHDIKIINAFKMLKHLGTKVTNQNYNHGKGLRAGKIWGMFATIHFRIHLSS
jgi:hypothetical protein